MKTIVMMVAALAACGRPSPPEVPLGDAARFALLAKTRVAFSDGSTVMGDVGVSPAPAASLVGVALTPDASGTFATAPGISGTVYAADDAPPTPAALASAVDAMQRAVADAAGRASEIVDLDGGALLRRTLVTGVYHWNGAVTVPLDVKLDGSADDVWIFQVAGDLTIADGVQVRMIGDPPVPRHVFWQVSGQATLGSGAHLEGVVLAGQAVALRAGASVAGRVLSQGTISADAATVVEPAP
jgi:hypothetical protein